MNTEDVQEYADKKNMMFYEVSAKTSDRVEEAFLTVAKKLMVKRDE